MIAPPDTKELVIIEKDHRRPDFIWGESAESQEQFEAREMFIKLPSGKFRFAIGLKYRKFNRFTPLPYKELELIIKYGTFAVKDARSENSTKRKIISPDFDIISSVYNDTLIDDIYSGDLSPGQHMKKLVDQQFANAVGGLNVYNAIGDFIATQYLNNMIGRQNYTIYRNPDTDSVKYGEFGDYIKQTSSPF